MLLRLRLLFLFSLLSIPFYSQDILWEKTYGGKQAEYLLDAQPTADYGFILAGSSLSGKTGNKEETSQGSLDYWIWKMDETGSLDWQKTLGGSGTDLLYSVCNTKDGGFILGGTSDSDSGLHKKDACRGKEDLWIIKLNAKGGEEWQHTLGGSGQDLLKVIVESSDGGYIIGGSSASDRTELISQGKSDPYGKNENSRGNLDYWIVKLDKKGEIEWQKTYGGLYSDILESLAPTKDGGCIAGGYSNSPVSGDKTEAHFGSGDYWILKLDKEGSIEWQRTYGGDKDDHLYVITSTKEGGYIAGGNSSSETTGNKNKPNQKGTDFWIIKLNENGDKEWEETYDFGKVDILTSLIENKDGSYLIGGYAQTEQGVLGKTDKKGINDYAALRINSEGEEQWRTTVGSSGEDILRKLIETRDGGYLLAGTSDGKISRDKKSSRGRNDFWVVKLKDKQKPEEDNSRAMLEAIPNPAQGYTNIIVGFEFTTGTATLYDLSGRQLQHFAVDQRTIPVDLSPYPQGIYIVQVTTNAGTDSVKVMKANK